MAKVCIEDSTLISIGNAIREKTGNSELLFPSEMPSAIESIKGSSSSGDLEISDCSHLFYLGNRLDILDDLLKICKNVTSTTDMFRNCSSLKNLNLSNFDTSQVINMYEMFYGCSKLTSLDLSNFDTSNVTNMYSMFRGCTNLKDLDLSSFDTSNVTNMIQVFQTCNNLITIPQLDASKATSINSIFDGCLNLTNLGGLVNLGEAYSQKSTNYPSYTLDLSTCTNLTKESLLNVINGLYDLNLKYDVANGGTLYTQTLKLGTTNLAKLTAEEISLATIKGWSVS